MEKKNGGAMFCEVCQRVGPHLRLKKVVSNRVAKLRGYGNAIVPALAAEFIKAYMETL